MQKQTIQSYVETHSELYLKVVKIVMIGRGERIMIIEILGIIAVGFIVFSLGLVTWGTIDDIRTWSYIRKIKEKW